MKQILAFLVAIGVQAALHGQCTIDPNAFSGPGDYGIAPDTTVNLPLALEGTPYTTVLQVYVDPDTVMPIGTFPITMMILDSITGLPPGFSYAPNPSNGQFQGGTYGCLSLSGTANSGLAQGGPNGDGIFPLFLHVSTIVNVLSAPTAFPQTIRGYRMEINAPTLLDDQGNMHFRVDAPKPQPATSKTEFGITCPFASDLRVNLLHVSGKEIATQSMPTTQGSNRYILETGHLPSGMYLCTFQFDGTTITKRLLVVH